MYVVKPVEMRYPKVVLQRKCTVTYTESFPKSTVVGNAFHMLHTHTRSQAVVSTSTDCFTLTLGLLSSSAVAAVLKDLFDFKTDRSYVI